MADESKNYVIVVLDGPTTRRNEGSFGEYCIRCQQGSEDDSQGCLKHLIFWILLVAAAGPSPLLLSELNACYCFGRENGPTDKWEPN